MRYFDSLPNTLTIDYSGNAVVVKNILTKAVLPVSVLYNPLVFYRYDVQDHDTPESIANKYYGDSYRFWLVLLPNQIIDPQWDWPMSPVLFNDYVNTKYTPSELTEVHHYEKIITKIDNTTNTTTTETIVIDEDTYNHLTESTSTYTSPPNSLNTINVTVNITKNIVDNLHYEMSLNDSKRSIKLINKKYADQIEKELKTLMGT